jgi:hypothetical protein
MEVALTMTGDEVPFNVVAALHLGNPPAPAAFEQALAWALQRHPILGMRIIRRGSAYSLEPASEPCLPLIEVLLEHPGPSSEASGSGIGAATVGPPSHSPGERRAWHDLVEAELSRRLDPESEPLLQCRWLGDAEAATLVFTAHHGVVDATSVTALLAELLQHCDGMHRNGMHSAGVHSAGTHSAGIHSAEARGEPPDRVLACAPAPVSRFPAAFRGWRRLPRVAAFLGRQMADELGFALGSRGQRRPACPIEGPNRVLTARLDRQTTSALTRTCRRWRIPLHAVLNAAMLLAVRRDLYGSRARLMRYVTFADLRRRLDPPPEPEDLVAALAMLRLTAAMPSGDTLGDLRDLAGRIAVAVHRAGHRGDPLLAHLLSPQVMSMMLRRRPGRMAAAAVSYTGPTRLEPAYGDIEVRGLDAFVSNIHIGPELAAQVRLLFGELWWDLLYLERELDRRTAVSLADRTLELLAEAAAETPPARAGAR